MTQEVSISTQTMQIEDDRRLWDVVLGVYGYPALLLAHKLDMFSLLADGALTLPGICEKLNIKKRPAEAILTAATALGFLSLQDERYSLTSIAEQYLLKKKSKLFRFFLGLDDRQRSGTFVCEPGEGGAYGYATGLLGTGRLRLS